MPWNGDPVRSRPCPRHAVSLAECRERVGGARAERSGAGVKVDSIDRRRRL